MDVSIEVTGSLEGLNEAIAQAVNELGGAIAEEMEEIKATSQEIVPFRFGILKASADAVGVNVEHHADGGLVAIGYGGAASAYSVIQHENPEFRHAEGKTWKYLEMPVMEAVNGMEGRLAARIRSRMNAR